MTPEMIEKFIDNKGRKDLEVHIHFKQRSTIKGLFIRTADYDQLKSKNFWRIVAGPKIDEWKKTKDINLAKIFSGTEITRLSENN